MNNLPKIIYAKLHAPVSLPPQMQVPVTLSTKVEADKISLEIEGQLLKISYKGATGYTPLTNVVCIQCEPHLKAVK